MQEQEPPLLSSLQIVFDPHGEGEQSETSCEGDAMKSI